MDGNNYTEWEDLSGQRLGRPWKPAKIDEWKEILVGQSASSDIGNEKWKQWNQSISSHDLISRAKLTLSNSSDGSDIFFNLYFKKGLTRN